MAKYLKTIKNYMVKLYIHKLLKLLSLMQLIIGGTQC